jgi:hypothetical protein
MGKRKRKTKKRRECPACAGGTKGSWYRCPQCGAENPANRPPPPAPPGFWDTWDGSPYWGKRRSVDPIDYLRRHGGFPPPTGMSQ